MTNIYVGNLPYGIHEDQLIEHFGRWGAVERATLVFDRETGRPRGFGFVEMVDAEDAQTAIEKSHGEAFHGRPLTVNQARPRGSGMTTNTAQPAATHHRPTVSRTATSSYHGSEEMQPVGGGGYSNSIYN